MTLFNRLTVTAFALLITASAFAQKDTLRILAFGNSFSEDATQQYLYDIAKSDGIEFIIGNMNIGGCPLEKHWKNIESGEKVYGYNKNVGGKRKSVKASFLEGLTDEKWDIITFQQASSYSGLPETYEPYLGNIYEYVKANATGTPKYYWHQTWAYAKNSTHGAFGKYKKSQEYMYECILDAAGKACKKYGFPVIPSGTAVQNGRSTFLDGNFSRDGGHMSLTNGRFTVACTWFETLTGHDVRNVQYKPEELMELAAEIGKEAAHCAVLKPWEVTELKQYSKENAIFSKINLDESKVPSFTLPDALTMQDGRKVKDKKDWFENRRPELLNLFTEEMFGKSPVEIPEGTTFEVVETSADAFNGLATRKQVKITFPDLKRTKKKRNCNIMLLVYTPNKNTSKGAPIFLGINFKGNETITEDPAVIPALKNGNTFGIYEKAGRGSMAYRWNVETLLKRGYGVATFFRSDIAADFDTFSTGINALLDGNRNKGDEWGRIAAWVWGIRRAIDYLETDKDVNAKKIAVIGHSRLGKTALWAGATDPRIAMVISNDSGCCGAAISRRRFGETVWSINTVFPYWFCKNFRKYCNNEDALPFDQHELIALSAPRPVYVASSSEDLWADPKGEKMALDEATKVYEFLGFNGKTGYHCKNGKHNITSEDWTHYLDFADKHLK